MNKKGYLSSARLAQSVERKALNLVVVGSSPTVGVLVGVHAWVWLRSKGGVGGGAKTGAVFDAVWPSANFSHF